MGSVLIDDSCFFKNPVEYCLNLYTVRDNIVSVLSRLHEEANKIHKKRSVEYIRRANGIKKLLDQSENELGLGQTIELFTKAYKQSPDNWPLDASFIKKLQDYGIHID